MEVRRLDLANWALRTSPKFTTGVKYQFHQGFFFIRSYIRKFQSLFAPREGLRYAYWCKVDLRVYRSLATLHERTP